MLAVVALLLGLVFSPAFIAAGVLFLVFLIGLVVSFLGRSADSQGTQPDPVTGGRRWWQKRWDE